MKFFNLNKHKKIETPKIKMARKKKSKDVVKAPTQKLSPEEMWTIHTQELIEKPKWNCKNRKEPQYTYHARIILNEAIEEMDDNKFKLGEHLEMVAEVLDRPNDWYLVKGVPITFIRPNGSELTRKTDNDGDVDFTPDMLGVWKVSCEDIDYIAKFNVV